MDKIEIRVPAKENYLKSLRLLSASIASDMGFDIEAVEDIRVVVSEAVNYKLGQEYVDIKFYVKEDSLTVLVLGKDKKIDKQALEMRNLILEVLADEAYVSEDEIRLVKRVKNDKQ
ncbi:MAG: anti-sigma regulatory factor [Peptoniphilaceae bacterium]|nr:anti-sigma regulatory factor [Peptoniphilaceae bacterium]MDY6018917.1 anti-sigma regulatory factor [Anaerococcus sp.]